MRTNVSRGVITCILHLGFAKRNGEHTPFSAMYYNTVMRPDWKDHQQMPKPKNDDGYFETMSRAVFAAGLNWKVIDNKWPEIKTAFENFSVRKVAGYHQDNIDKLMSDKRVVRNFKKLNAVVTNAKAIVLLQKHYKSVANYLDSFKDQPKEKLLKDLGKRFSFMGTTTAQMFLYGCGEKTSHLG